MSAPDIFSIGVLSERSGVNIETIRYYERAGLLHRIDIEDGGAVHLAPQEAHADPVFQVDGGVQDHVPDRSLARAVRSGRSRLA